MAQAKISKETRVILAAVLTLAVLAILFLCKSLIDGKFKIAADTLYTAQVTTPPVPAEPTPEGQPPTPPGPETTATTTATGTPPVPESPTATGTSTATVTATASLTATTTGPTPTPTSTATTVAEATATTTTVAGSVLFNTPEQNAQEFLASGIKSGAPFWILVIIVLGLGSVVIYKIITAKE